MKSIFSILPEQASTFASKIDSIYIFLLIVSFIFTVLTAGLVITFVIKYWRRSETYRPEPPHESSTLEIICSVVLFILVMIMFSWGAFVFQQAYKPPHDAIEVLVVGKQWMWKMQHPQGKREINELHVPVGQAVKLTMTSEDVIHSFYIPAFRIKNDVLPGRYTTAWFEATKPGKYHIFCAEYCGTEHSQMGGWIHVLPAAEYEEWLRGAPLSSGGVQESPVVAGEQLFKKLGCVTCHNGMSGALGPDLKGVYGTQRELSTGDHVEADDDYLRESILNSQAKLVVGYQPVMPLFKGLVTEDQLMQIIAYIKSLSTPEGTQ